MKNKLFILFSIFTMSFAFVDDVKVNASSKVTETIEYHNMIINVAKNEGKMIETLTLANYGVMHGDAKVDDVKEYYSKKNDKSNESSDELGVKRAYMWREMLVDGLSGVIDDTTSYITDLKDDVINFQKYLKFIWFFCRFMPY